MPTPIEKAEDLSADQVYDQYTRCVQKILSHTRSFLGATISENKNVFVTVGLIGAILFRMIECVESILILSEEKRSRDMAILLLNLMELRVDLQYIALSPKRELEWLEHRNGWHKPWTLEKQLKDIFHEPSEKEAETTIYHMLSMIKHGSPVEKISGLTDKMTSSANHGNMAFPITCDGKRLSFDPENLNQMAGFFLFAAGSNILTGTRAASKILARRDISFPLIDKKIADELQALSSINECECARRMVQWARSHDPKLDRVCEELQQAKRRLRDLSVDKVSEGRKES